MNGGRSEHGFKEITGLLNGIKAEGIQSLLKRLQMGLDSTFHGLPVRPAEVSRLLSRSWACWPAKVH